jgi:hypothetical protein
MLEVEHRLPGERTVDPVDGELREGKDLVEAPLRGGHQRAIAAHPQDDTPAGGLEQVVDPRTGSAGGRRAGARLGVGDGGGKNRARGERRTHRQGDALALAPCASSQLAETPPLA